MDIDEAEAGRVAAERTREEREQLRMVAESAREAAELSRANNAELRKVREQLEKARLELEVMTATSQIILMQLERLTKDRIEDTSSG